MEWPIGMRVQIIPMYRAYQGDTGIRELVSIESRHIGMWRFPDGRVVGQSLSILEEAIEVGQAKVIYDPIDVMIEATE